MLSRSWTKIVLISKISYLRKQCLNYTIRKQRACSTRLIVHLTETLSEPGIIMKQHFRGTTDSQLDWYQHHCNTCNTDKKGITSTQALQNQTSHSPYGKAIEYTQRTRTRLRHGKQINSICILQDREHIWLSLKILLISN